MVHPIIVGFVSLILYLIPLMKTCDQRVFLSFIIMYSILIVVNF